MSKALVKSSKCKTYERASMEKTETVSEIQAKDHEEGDNQQDAVSAVAEDVPDNSTTVSDENAQELAFASGASNTSPQVSGKIFFTAKNVESHLVCITVVPGLMTAPDFCQFVLPFASVVRRVRLLHRVGENNRYTAMMEFAKIADARKFCDMYEGKEFLGGLIKERCRVRMVEQIKFEGDGKGKPYPYGEMFVDLKMEEDTACAVCLERMSVEDGGLVTTICHHAMHLKCLSKWDLNTCPVCRYRHELTPEGSLCMKCDSPNDVWMCLICANVACGRMNAQHAQEHFENTNHPFAINLSDTVFWTGDKVKAGSVWDYISERFVNRLLSSDDGKVVEFVQHHSPRESDQCYSSDYCSAAGAGAVNDIEEVEDRQMQAAVYASRMDATVAEYRMTIESLKSTHAAEMQRTSDQIHDLEATKATLTSELESVRQKLAATLKEKKSLAKKLSDSRKSQDQQGEKMSFLKKLYETLLRDKNAWARRVESLEDSLKKEVTEKNALEEQLRDMMLHMEMQKRIDGAGGCGTEASGGDVIGVGATPRERLRRMRGRG